MPWNVPIRCGHCRTKYEPGKNTLPPPAHYIKGLVAGHLGAQAGEAIQQGRDRDVVPNLPRAFCPSCRKPSVECPNCTEWFPATVFTIKAGTNCTYCGYAVRG